MLFNSIEFLIFFPIVTLLYFMIPHKYRWFHLLLASCVFYAFFIPIYILILFLTIIIDYYAGLKIEAAPSHQKKLFLTLSIVANVGILAVFKYYNFFIENINFVFNQPLLPLLEIILPIGLSFHTFQAMSYTIEVYRGNQKAERHFGIYALYVMFYPQLVAGPIERPQNLLPQIREKKVFDYYNVTDGLRQMLWGFFKKCVIADRLAAFVDTTYNQPKEFAAITLLLASIFFSFQIYCDFSGYSDIAIGSAKVMGFKLMKNFDNPFQSATISEFWRQWHISLSSWFREYVYIPLGGNRTSSHRWHLTLLLVFLLSGLWHGAAWTFLVWGGIHGTYLILGNITRSIRQKIDIFLGLNPKIGWYKCVQIIFTFLLVTFAFIFFRANSIQDAIYIISQFSDVFNNWGYHDNFLLLKSGSILNISNSATYLKFVTVAFLLIIFLEIIQYWQKKKNLHLIYKKQPLYVRWIGYYLAIIMLAYLGIFEKQDFIYFQF